MASKIGLQEVEDWILVFYLGTILGSHVVGNSLLAKLFAQRI